MALEHMPPPVTRHRMRVVLDLADTPAHRYALRALFALAEEVEPVESEGPLKAHAWEELVNELEVATEAFPVPAA